MHLDFYGYLTLVALLVVLIGCTALFIWVIGLPGKIAIARDHSDAEAVKLMGNLGFLGGISWLYALIWSIKDTDTIDIRRFPKEEQAHIKEEITRLKERHPRPRNTDPQHGE